MSDIDFIIGRKVAKIGNLSNNIRDKFLRENNITPSQSSTLIFYFSNPGKSITDLKNHLQISHQAARKLVEKLRQKEYLYIVSSKDDGRVANVFLTDNGQDISTKLINDGSRAGANLLKDFSAEEKKVLFSFLMRMEENITK